MHAAAQEGALWSVLPSDLVLKIFSQLREPDKKAARLVCSAWCLAMSATVTKLRYDGHAFKYDGCVFQTSVARPLSATFRNVQHVDLNDRLTVIGPETFGRLMRSLPQLKRLTGQPMFEVPGSLTPQELVQTLQEAQPDAQLSLDFLNRESNALSDVLDVLQRAALLLTGITNCPRALLYDTKGQVLSDLTSLQTLHFDVANGNRLASVAPIAQLTQLSALHLQGAILVSSLALLSSLTNLTQLEWYQDTEQHPPHGAAFWQLAARLPTLKAVDVTSNWLETEARRCRCCRA
ncbi:hypothetical protein WJX72_011473 [[Myrmecia] bisecta]|uniref:F-box domain-containing protein n=1 Tax=[Myrmecia] bisecta TaxID=41462 RepID=A0AAW1QSU9_9CHLO